MSAIIRTRVVLSIGGVLVKTTDRPVPKGSTWTAIGDFPRKVTGRPPPVTVWLYSLIQHRPQPACIREAASLTPNWLQVVSVAFSD
jgi:hypothetical protein